MSSARERPPFRYLLAAALACAAPALPAGAQSVDELFGLDEEAGPADPAETRAAGG